LISIGRASPCSGRTVKPSTDATPGARSSTDLKKPRTKMNTPFVGLELTGRVVRTLVAGRTVHAA